MQNTGVIGVGVRTPFIKEGDDIVKIVVDSILESSWNGKENKYDIDDTDVIGITESVIARSAGLYVTVDEIAKDVKSRLGACETVTLVHPIYSRNRFSMILKGIARAAKKVIIFMPEYDEVGNPSGVNPFTGVDIEEYYKSIIEGEGAEPAFYHERFENYLMDFENSQSKSGSVVIYCGLHDYAGSEYLTLADICSDKNPDFGLLGSNKATEERLKLFPTKELATNVCVAVKAQIKAKTGKDVYVGAYGDGCFKSLLGEIWECADPTTMPGYTDPEVFESTPNEIKLKAVIDQSASFAEVRKAISCKPKNLVGKMSAQGTTPRLYRDLLASLMDLLSGSGDKGTPVVWIKNYFKTYLD